MIAALLLAAAAPQTPVEAEYAFIADAKAIGQWTAFRKWATPDATFLPPDGTIHDALKDAKDPPVAVDWWPTASYLSCDGKVGANTGGALWPGGRNSYFSTIWKKQADGGWRYVLDNGDDLAVARPRPEAGGPAIRRASCENKPRGLIQARIKGTRQGSGTSPDKTLGWSWTVQPDGAIAYNVHLWNGTGYDLVIADRIAAKPKPAPKPAA